ncbi:MAG: cellulose synthase subunit BcsC-related outer membrane protein [Cyanobacterium sp.]
MKKKSHELIKFLIFLTFSPSLLLSSKNSLQAIEMVNIDLFQKPIEEDFFISNNTNLTKIISNPSDYSIYSFSNDYSFLNQQRQFSDTINNGKSNLIASPENFNPSLRQPDITPFTTETLPPQRDSFQLESITPSIYLETDNFGQRNIYREVLLEFQGRNDNKFDLRTGINSFKETDVEDITQIPLVFGWQKQLNKTNLNLNLGIDFFDRVRNSPNFRINAEQPLSIRVNEVGELQSLFVAGATIEHQAYKFNATTIENEITSWRFTPQFYWLIAPDLSLFSFAQYGTFSDGNDEFQSFTRLEKTFGEFSLSGNLFVWSFAENLESSSGYFSPPDFLVSNLELAWRRQFSDSLTCRLAGSFGRQRLEGDFSNAFVYEGLCQASLSPQTVLDLSYRVSNILSAESGADSFRNEQFKAQVKFSF